MATWTTFRYGKKAHQEAQRWVPTATTSSLRGVLVFVHGGGWNEGNPLGLFDATSGKSVFLDFIEPNEAVTGEDVVVIAMKYGHAAYNEQATATDVPAWDNATDYSGIQAAEDPEDVDVVGNSTVVYRCIQANGPATTVIEPGVHASTADYWYAIPDNDPSGALFAGQSAGGGLMGSPNSVTNTEPASYPSTPRFWANGVDDLFELLSFLKLDPQRKTTGSGDNKYLQIDTDKFVVYGESAGGALAGSVAYAESGEYAASGGPGSGRLYSPHADTNVQAAILEITPDDWRSYPYGSLHVPFLCGLNGTSAAITTEWHTTVPAAVKAGLSPVGVLEATGNHKPTFLYYPNSTDTGASPSAQTDGGHSYTGWATAQYHEADGGRIIKEKLEALGQTNVKFFHDGNAPTEDVPTSGIGLEMWNWLKLLWSYPLS